MRDMIQAAINALREAGKEDEAKAVEALRDDMKRTMDGYHLGTRASYESGFTDGRRSHEPM